MPPGAPRRVGYLYILPAFIVFTLFVLLPLAHAVWISFFAFVQFFEKVGFHMVERGVLPLKAWKDCLRCPKFQACDEIAVLRILRPDNWNHAHSPVWAATSPEEQLIQLPTPFEPRA